MIIIYDLETTGFTNQYSDNPDDQPGIVQIGAVKYDNDMNLVAEFDALVNPELVNPSKWTEDAMEVNNIRPEDVVDAPTFFSVLPRFAEFCRGGEYWLGYNHIEFDNVVLDWQLKRYGFSHHFPWPLTHIDIMLIASEEMNMRGKRGRKNPKLGEIYQELFEKELEGAHNALLDVLGTGDVFRELGGLGRCGYVKSTDRSSAE